MVRANVDGPLDCQSPLLPVDDHIDRHREPRSADQLPYFPIGPLLSAILFSRTEVDITDNVIREKLSSCGVEHLNDRLSLLSGGQQQRLAFARVLVVPPDILIMDEPTASLDELSQFKVMGYMRDQLGNTMMLHVGHRPGLEHFHNREIQLVRTTTGGPATTAECGATIAERLRRVVRSRS